MKIHPLGTTGAEVYDTEDRIVASFRDIADAELFVNAHQLREAVELRAEKSFGIKGVVASTIATAVLGLLAGLLSSKAF